MRKRIRHFDDAHDAAISQQEALIEAQDLLASHELAFGMHHHSILILAKTKSELEEQVANITKLYRDHDLVVVRESLNLESAFWAQIPGNFSFIRRNALISSDNFADFCSLHNFHHGYMNHNHLGSAVMLVESSSRTPLYINFHEHASGKKNDLSKGHTTIIAPSNAGKTTLMLALDAQTKKYQSTSFFFDRDRGCEIYVRAMGGYYTSISPEQPTGFNPLQLADTPVNRDFLVKWLGSLLLTNEEELSPLVQNQVEEVIQRNFSLPLHQRKLSVIANFFPSHFEKWHALEPWISSHSSQKNGRLAYLFDHDEDQLSLNTDIAGFDMTHLLDHETPSVISSVMMYLFHRIEERLDGRLVGVYLDEGWQLLESPYWRRKMRQYLATMRKLNAYLVFATQLPSSVAQSSLRAALIEGAATQIFLPNPKAEKEDYVQGFKLTESEFAFIKNAQDRRFLIKQGHEVAIGKLNLSGLEDYLAVFSANKTTLNLLDEIREEVGDDPKLWLPLFHERRPK